MHWLTQLPRCHWLNGTCNSFIIIFVSLFAYCLGFWFSFYFILSLPDCNVIDINDRAKHISSQSIPNAHCPTSPFTAKDTNVNHISPDGRRHHRHSTTSVIALREGGNAGGGGSATAVCKLLSRYCRWQPYKLYQLGETHACRCTFTNDRHTFAAGTL